MKPIANMKLTSIYLVIALALVVGDANAAISNDGLMNTVLEEFRSSAATWANIFKTAADWLFWTLATISMVWTFGMMALRKADIGEFYAEFARFTIMTGFFYWLLSNGPAMASAIIASLQKLGGNAAALNGYTDSLLPSGIIDTGFILLGRALSSMALLSPVDSVVGVILGLAILLLCTLIAVNMLLLLISAWVLAYAGIFFLGFGGSKWTSDMAINYYKTVLGIATQIMVMILLVGIGRSLIDSYYLRMTDGVKFAEMAVILVIVLIVFILTNKLPQLISGIITGASVGGGGIGAFGAGAAVGAAGMAAAAAATGGAAFMAGAANISGGAQALMAAFKGAQSNVAAGSDITSRLAGAMGGGGDSGGGGSDSGGGSPLASAMGLNSSGGASSGGGSSNSEGGGSSGGGSSNSEGGGSSGGGSNSSEGGGSSGDGSNSSEGSGSSGGGSNSSEGSGSSGGGSGSSSKLATAGKIAADMGANLAAGMGRAAANKAAAIADSTKARIADTAGGRLAQEISNPGAASQERRDNQDIAKAESIMSQQSRSEQAEEAREFLAQQSAPSFEGDSIGSAGSNSDVNAEEEIAAFRDRNQNA